MATIGLILGVALAGASAEPAGAWRVEDIRWEAAAPNGTRYALLEGRRDRRDVPFSYAFFIPAGVWDTPHVHSAAARIFVAKGALKIAYGAMLDRTAASVLPAGSYALVPAGATHFDGADEDTIIIGTATGPWRTTYRDGSAPASAGTPLGH